MVKTQILKVFKALKYWNLIKNYFHVIRYTLHVTRSKGFTLIEMMVTVGIIGMMLIAAIPAYGKYAERQKLNQAAEQVASVIRQTQNLALAPAEDKSQEQNFYAFHCINGEQVYSINCYKRENSQVAKSKCSESDSSSQYKNFSLSNDNVVFESGCSSGEIPSVNDISFQIPSGKIFNINNSEIVLINNKLASPNNTRKVKVNHETGQVEIE